MYMYTTTTSVLIGLLSMQESRNFLVGRHSIQLQAMTLKCTLKKGWNSGPTCHYAHVCVVICITGDTCEHVPLQQTPHLQPAQSPLLLLCFHHWPGC